MKTIFTDGDWCVRRSDLTVNVYAHHTPCDNTMISAVLTNDPFDVCYVCKTTVPEGIHALVLLHNWEYE